MQMMVLPPQTPPPTAESDAPAQVPFWEIGTAPGAELTGRVQECLPSCLLFGWMVCTGQFPLATAGRTTGLVCEHFYM